MKKSPDPPKACSIPKKVGQPAQPPQRYQRQSVTNARESVRSQHSTMARAAATTRVMFSIVAFMAATLQGVSSMRYSHMSGQNHFGLHSLIVPLPCQADVLYEQLNYICVNNEIKCLPGWKVGRPARNCSGG